MDITKIDTPDSQHDNSYSGFTMVDIIDSVEISSHCSEEPRTLSSEVEDDIARISMRKEESVRKKDEYYVDFDDARQFAAFRWQDILKATDERISPADRRMAARYGDWQDVVTDIQSRLKDAGSGLSMKRQISKIMPLPRTLADLTRTFSKLVHPREVKFDLLWGLIYLVLKHSYASPDRLKRTAAVLHKIRGVVLLFNKIVVEVDDNNEALLALVEFIDPIMTILADLLEYLHTYSSESRAEQAWPDLSDSINSQLQTLDEVVKHVSEICSYTKVNMDRNIKNMSLRHALNPESEEPGTFPIRILPFSQNPRFYGREDELRKINEFLKPTSVNSLRTYTIFGRRGVGKTEIASQFAYANEAGFDAIFWIQCETSVVIRQSFTNVAIALNLPGAERDSRHEENLLAVQSWLKRTQKRWLLIFDNAERDQILLPYWPIGADGAILITSRKYHNFAKDLLRAGNTVKPFDSAQSWDLLIRLLGDEWKALDQEGKIPASEILAARKMLGKLEGLALAIQQAAVLIKNPEIGGATIAKTYEMFKEKIRTLPERFSAPRSNSESALDALWDMTFNFLSENARSLLGILAWLSPDNILIETFLPRNQSALTGALSFCRQDPIHIRDKGKATLASVVTPSLGFDKALGELLKKELIKQDGRVLSIHRVVQEAVNYHGTEWLQESFDTATRLIFEQFPEQKGDATLYNHWNVCSNYIHHGVNLSKKFSDQYTKTIKPTEYFVKLLSNCGWYLYELGDYDVSKRVVETAQLACDNKKSLLYAQLLNTAGAQYYDTNRLQECKNNWENVLRIRKEELPHDHPSIAAINNNLGNLETALGNVEESRDYFERARLIWIAGGDATAEFLALTYLCMGRMHMLRLNLKEAERMTLLAESLFVRTIGDNKAFMTHVHYAHGNIQYRYKEWGASRRAFEACLKIAKKETPIHPITAAAYFSIGCVEFELQHYDNAKSYLDKARTIAELRSPTRDDGSIARILWKTACVLEANTFGEYAIEAEQLRTRAEVAKNALLASGERGVIPFVDDTEEDRVRDPEEDSFDALVPLFFR